MNYKLRDTFLEDGFYVTQNYMNNPAYYAQFGLQGHEGLDLGHKDKTVLVRSPLSGTAFVSTDKNYGNYCVIEDYKQQCGVYICHMQSIKVVSGQEIRVGQQIGEMDDTGNANGEHVHLNFLILENGNNKYKVKKYNYGYLDPQYPRDTGKTVKFDGVEDYTIQWGEGVTTENIDQLRADLAEANKHKDNLQKQVDGLLADRTSAEKKYEECNTQRVEALASAEGFRKQLNDFVAKLASILGTRQETVEIIASIETAITFEDKAAELERRIELEEREHAKAVDVLEAKIQALESNLATLKADFKALKDTQTTPTQPTTKLSIIELIKKLFGVK